MVQRGQGVVILGEGDLSLSGTPVHVKGSFLGSARLRTKQTARKGASQGFARLRGRVAASRRARSQADQVQMTTTATAEPISISALDKSSASGT